MKTTFILFLILATAVFAVDQVKLVCYNTETSETKKVSPAMEFVDGEPVYLEGVRVKSPDGNVWEIRVDNSGNITATDLSL